MHVLQRSAFKREDLEAFLEKSQGQVNQISSSLMRQHSSRNVQPSAA
jgi:hypothetical protein